MSERNDILVVEGNDPAMAEAYKCAQETFKYFWRELSWEYRRVIPALDLACVKIAFTDGDSNREGPSHEHMWISDVQFDGSRISGTLMNSPRWLTNINEGDPVIAKLSELEDWMFAIHGKVYGAFTVNLLRSRMSPSERKAHDGAWGLDFGDPFGIELVYQGPKKKAGILQNIFGRKEGPVDSPDASDSDEHPMSVNMGDAFREQIKSSPEFLHHRDEHGWTMLHREALAGNLTSVKILIEQGADKSLTTNDGYTPLDLARVLNWNHVTNFLQKV